MTEAEWLACLDSKLVFEAHARGLSNRKLILFCVQCCRRSLTKGKVTKSLTERWHLTEQFADGEVDTPRLRRKWGHSPRIDTLCWPERAEEWVGVWVRKESTTMSYPPDETMVHLLHDIFGNPFRSVAFNPDWRTPDAVARAGGMYESRKFTAMPALADALEEAGCDQPDVLTHCRDPQATHVRGCWVVDLVIGKG